MYLEKLCGEASIFLTGFDVLSSTDTSYVWYRQPPAGSTFIVLSLTVEDVLEMSIKGEEHQLLKLSDRRW
jgi:hypothetical protein